MTARASRLTVTPLLGFPEVRRGDDLTVLVLKALNDNAVDLRDGDILVISSKIASKAMGLTSPLTQRADLVVSQTLRVVAERMSPFGITRIVESVAGPVMAAAGVDASNTSDESIVLTLPEDPDAVAADIRAGVEAGWASRSGAWVRLGVVLSDTAGRPWRIGQVDFALGAAGIRVIDDLRGSNDADGRLLSVTERCVADEMAAAADLVKGKSAGIPVAHLRGLGQYVPAHRRDQPEPHHDDDQGLTSLTASPASGQSAMGARDLVRTGPGDWFGLGRAEAVRSALGVEPGSAIASEIGIATVDPEHADGRAGRALRVALVNCPDVSGHLEGGSIRLMSDDEFSLGVAAARAEVALHGEGLVTTLARSPAPAPAPTVATVSTVSTVSTAEMMTAQPSAVIAFR